jgi:ferritin-like metal-binding protein YciE
MFADLKGPRKAEQDQLLAWLSEACQTERRLSTQIRDIAMFIPYDAFRAQLEVMAGEDEQHANLLQEHIQANGGDQRQPLGAHGMSPKGELARPWQRLLRVLADKRQRYEGYRHQASTLGDPALQALLRRLQDDEEKHQEQLVELLTKLDAHVHERMA